MTSQCRTDWVNQRSADGVTGGINSRSNLSGLNPGRIKGDLGSALNMGNPGLGHAIQRKQSLPDRVGASTADHAGNVKR